MYYPIPSFILFLCFLFSAGYAQEKKYGISATDLKQTGVNKVLCMSNGNTMLFHFEPAKEIVVKVFDSDHKEVASQKNLFKILDIHEDEYAVFKGLFEINGEAVLFIEQTLSNKNGLTRLRFNITDGTLIEEKLIESTTIHKQATFCVMKNKNEDNYAILFCADDRNFLECKVHVAYYNNKHEKIRDVPIEVDRKKYDFIVVSDAESQPNGISISISLEKIIENGTNANRQSGSISTPSTYDHYLAMYYIPTGSTTVLNAAAHLATNTFPFYSNYTYNPFAKALNLLLLSYNEIKYKYGLEWLPAAEMQHILFKIDESSMAVNYKWISNKSANDFLKKKTDSSAFFEGLPVNMYTNENGLSTIISESYSRYWEPETRVRTNNFTYFGNVGITQIDDDGNEIWGTVLPLSQRYKSYERYYNPYNLSKKWQCQNLFGDLPDAVYERQFVSINSYCHDKNFYIVFNDVDKNFNSSIEKRADTVYSFNRTNACYYKMDRKKEITKHYVFGEPGADEYKSSFIEGADFDEKRGVYASLIQYKKGNDISLCMAWSHLE